MWDQDSDPIFFTGSILIWFSADFNISCDRHIWIIPAKDDKFKSILETSIESDIWNKTRCCYLAIHSNRKETLRYQLPLPHLRTHDFKLKVCIYHQTIYCKWGSYMGVFSRRIIDVWSITTLSMASAHPKVIFHMLFSPPKASLQQQSD